MISMAPKLDVIALVSGDGEFCTRIGLREKIWMPNRGGWVRQDVFTATAGNIR